MPLSYRREYSIYFETVDYYQNTIENFDPDVILFSSELDESYVKRVCGDRVVIDIKDFKESLLEEKQLYGLSALQMLREIVASEFKFQRVDQSKLFLPTPSRTCPLFNVHFGQFMTELYESTCAQLKDMNFFENPELTWENLSENYPHSNCSYDDINLNHIKIYPDRIWYRANAVYFLDETRTLDLINFWNLRALGWNVIPYPIGHLENIYYGELFKRFAHRIFETGNPGYTHAVVLTSAQANTEQIQSVRELVGQLNSQFPQNQGFAYQTLFPRFWDNRLILEADKAVCENAHVDSLYRQIEIEDDTLSFEPKRLPIDLSKNSFSKALYKIHLELTYFDDYGKYAGVISGITTSDWQKLTHSFGRWKVSSSGLTHFIENYDFEIRFTIPKAKGFFESYFSNKSLEMEVTANGKLAYEVLHNVGGVHGFGFVSNQSTIKLLELFESQKSVKLNHLVGEIKRSYNLQKGERANYIISQLIEKKVIEFGAEIQCSVCLQRSFYVLKELQEEMSCTTCRNQFEVDQGNPKSILWAYRGIGPYSRNNRVGGLMTVFLTLNLFSHEFASVRGDLTGLIGFELKSPKGELNEVDLAVMVQDSSRDGFQPDLLVCECKTFQALSDKDFDRMMTIGDKIPNSVLVFATVKDEFTVAEKSGLTKVVKHFRKGHGQRPVNSILLLTANELLPDKVLNYLSEYKSNASAYQRHNDWLGNLCEMSVHKYLGIKTWGEIQGEEWNKEIVHNVL